MSLAKRCRTLQSSSRQLLLDAVSFVRRQIVQVRHGGCAELTRKTKLALRKVLVEVPLTIFAVPVVLILRLIKPWMLVRWREMKTSTFGHLGGNTEIYLCERDAGINVPRQRHVDISFVQKRVSNRQLVKMWKRIHRVWPAWCLPPIRRVNRQIPGGAVHEIGNNTLEDRDVHNLYDRFPPHLKFTADEEARGEADLRLMGIPAGAPFVCMTVRDSAYYYQVTGQMNHENEYRDCDIQNFVLAAEELADRGYFVVRMGAKVRERINSDHPRVIDYATSGMRSDLLDIYLGARCEFCISTATGFDCVPAIFRRPIVFVNILPLGWLATWSAKFIHITRHHMSVRNGQELTLREIFECGVGFGFYTSDYETRGIRVIENTPEEIRDVVVEMAERLSGTWCAHEDDEVLQRTFWKIFPTEAKTADGTPINGEIRARFGAAFLRNNRGWLEEDGTPNRVVVNAAKLGIISPQAARVPQKSEESNPYAQ